MKWPFLNIGGTRRVQEERPPPGVQDFLDYTTEPGAGGSDAAHWYPEDSPDLTDDYFPTVARQAELLTHWYRPPPDQPTQWWYDDKNLFAKDQREHIEQQQAIPWPIETTRDYQATPDPRWTPPPVNRPTASMSPSSYRFTRPFDQEQARELNGLHMSLAGNRRAYMLYGSVGLQSPWDNSYRLDPPTNDATAVFVGDTARDVSAQVLVTRQVDVWPGPGAGYRLDG